jgi:hypothetical protein
MERDLQFHFAREATKCDEMRTSYEVENVTSLADTYQHHKAE